MKCLYTILAIVGIILCCCDADTYPKLVASKVLGLGILAVMTSYILRNREI